MDVDVGRENSVDDRAQGTGNDLGVSGLTNGLVKIPWSSFVSFRKGPLAVGSKIPCHLPGLSPIVGLLDVHGSRSEGLVGDDQVGDVELGLEVKLDRHVLHSVFGLPPGSVLVSLNLTRRLPTVNDVLNPMRGPRVPPQTFRCGITPKTFLSTLCLIQMGEDTVSLLSECPARRSRCEFVLAADEEVAGGGVTTPFVAASTDGGVTLFSGKY